MATALLLAVIAALPHSAIAQETTTTNVANGDTCTFHQTEAACAAVSGCAFIATNRSMPAFCQNAKYASGQITYSLAQLANVGLYAQATAKEFYMTQMGINREKHEEKLRDNVEALNTTIYRIMTLFPESYDVRMNQILSKFDTLVENIDFSAKNVLTTTTVTTTSGTTTGTTTTTTMRPLTSNMLGVYAAAGARIGGAVGDVKTGEGIMNIAEEMGNIYRSELQVQGVAYFLPRIFVNKKRILSQKTTKTSFLLGLKNKMLGYETDAFVAEAEAELLEDMSDFVDIHWGLLRGMSWLNWGGVAETCLMQSTGQVSYRWDHMVLPILRDVIYGVRMSDERWITLDTYCDGFLYDVENNLRLLVRPENGVLNRPEGTEGTDCDCRISIPRIWRGVMLALGDGITMVERMAKYFFEIASGTYITEARRDLGILVQSFIDGMAALTEGDQSKDMPSPPTQSLVQQLFNVIKQRFPKFKEVLMIRDQLCEYGKRCIDGVIQTDGSGVLFDDNTTLLLLDALTGPLKVDLRKAANEYAELCPTDVGCIMVRRASVQPTITEQLAKEAIMVSIFPNYSIYAKRANQSMTSAVTAFNDLITGVAGDLDMNQTRDSCILDSLDKARAERVIFETPVHAVVWAKNLSYDWRLEVQMRSKVMTDRANKIVNDMAMEKGTIGCEQTILTQSGFQQWRAGIALAGRVGALGQMAAKEFFSIQKMLDLNDPQYRLLIRQWNRTMQLTGDALEAEITTLTLGSMNNPDEPPTAPSQSIATAAFAALDTWRELKPLLIQHAANNKIWKTVSAMANEFSDKCDVIVDEYVTWCRRSGIDDDLTNPSAVDKTGKPAVLVQKMAKEAVLYSLYEETNLEQTFVDYDAAIVAIEDTVLANDECRKQALAKLAADYDREKPIVDIFRTKATYTVTQILDMINSTGGFYDNALAMQADFVNRNPTCTIESATVWGASAGATWLMLALYMFMTSA